MEKVEKLYGYAGKILRVNLSDGRIAERGKSLKKS